ncbi:MAG: helix-turn-helix domain-containing protein [Phycisphaerales bacterium]
MATSLPIPVGRLKHRREALGMSHATVAARSGVSEPTVKRILGGQLAEASFANVVAIAEALGMTVGLGETDAEELCRQQARRKAEQIARLVQGTSALESQAVDQTAYERLVERSFHELMAGSRRRLWAE